MLKNYLKVAFRRLRRHKGYALLNTSGLAVGIACFVLIFLFVQHEFSYDRFHEHADRIYRVVTHQQAGEAEVRRVSTSRELGPALERTFPEVQQATRIATERLLTLRYGEAFFEATALYAEPSLFEVFSFSMSEGHPATVLTRPHTAVITASLARTLFGSEDPLGQTVLIDLRNERQAFEITGVVDEVPEASHLAFDLLLPLASSYRARRTYSWTQGRSFRTYLLLSDSEAADRLASNLPAFARQNLGAEWVEQRAFRYEVEPLTEIYFSDTGASSYVYIFSAIAGLILLIACANYVNLVTARAASRSHEVGLRKVLGAGRGQLAKQFLGESVLFAGLAIPAALLLVTLALPTFNAWFGKTLTLDLAQNQTLLLVLVGVVGLVGFVAGSYPAFFLSAFKPVDVLRSSFRAKRQSAYVRRALIVFQFGITVALIVSATIIRKQLDYARHQDLGFDQDRVLAVAVKDRAVAAQIGAFKARLAQHAEVEQVAALQGIMAGLSGGTWSFQWTITPEGGDQAIALRVVGVDYEAMETMGLELVAGRPFSQAHPSDLDAVILNETAVRQLGWASAAEAVGQRMGGLQPIIGVVKDFDVFSKHHEVQPAVLRIVLDALDTVVIRLKEGGQAPLSFIEDQWKAFAPEQPFSFYFMEEGIDALYRKEQQLGRLVGWFSGLAIFIACLGLFGLAAFMADRRTKEIGIRKVFGATVPNIMVLLSKETAVLVVVACMLATPLAYVAMNRWLENFAYHVEISWWTFLLVGSLALVIAWLTVSYQSIRAALTNPVKALRYE